MHVSQIGYEQGRECILTSRQVSPCVGSRVHERAILVFEREGDVNTHQASMQREQAVPHRRPNLTWPLAQPIGPVTHVFGTQDVDSTLTFANFDPRKESPPTESAHQNTV